MTVNRVLSHISVKPPTRNSQRCHADSTNDRRDDFHSERKINNTFRARSEGLRQTVSTVVALTTTTTQLERIP